MKKRNLIAFAAVLVLLCNYLGVSQTGAWFVSGGSFSDNSYQAAQVMYLPALQTEAIYPEGVPRYGRLLIGTPEGAQLEDVVYLVPGQSLIDSEGSAPAYLSLENFSNVNTQVQVRIEINFDNQMYDDTGNVINTDSIVAQENFFWRQDSGNADVYYYGVEHTVADTRMFMPLLRVDFANRSSNTQTPADYDYGSNEAGVYEWVYQGTSAAWDLKRGGDSTIAPVTEGHTQFYNVIDEIILVAQASTDVQQQELFDDFFSGHYAGHEIMIRIHYYAKQTAAEWTLFSSEAIETELAYSRTNRAVN